MGLLLDTHYVFALAGAPTWIKPRERDFLTAYHLPFYVSAVSLWEMRLKWNAVHASGARKGPASPSEVLDFLRGENVYLLGVSLEHAATELATPLRHRDPFDELLLVQAQVEGHRLLTRDRALKGHPLVQSI